MNTESHNKQTGVPGSPGSILPHRQAISAPRVTGGAVVRLFKEGVRALALGDRRQGIGRFKEVLNAEPGHVPARRILGCALMEEGRPSEAAAEFKLAARLDTANPDIRCELGIALEDSGRAPEAARLYRRIVKSNPDCAQAWRLLARIHGLRHDYAGSVKALLRAAELDPGESYTWMHLALDYVMTSRHKEALDACKKALRLDPICAVSWLIAGVAQTNLGNLPEAIKAYENSVTLKQDNAPAWLNLGKVLGMSGRFREAEAILKYLQGLDPASAEELRRDLGTLARHPHRAAGKSA